jgi:hypothetical protein
MSVERARFQPGEVPGADMPPAPRSGRDGSPLRGPIPDDPRGPDRPRLRRVQAGGARGGRGTLPGLIVPALCVCPPPVVPRQRRARSHPRDHAAVVGAISIPIAAGLIPMPYPSPAMRSDSTRPVPGGQTDARVGPPSRNSGHRVRAGVPSSRGRPLPAWLIRVTQSAMSGRCAQRGMLRFRRRRRWSGSGRNRSPGRPDQPPTSFTPACFSFSSCQSR